jgi:hypothetical protein
MIAGTSREARYCLSSLPADAVRLNETVRAHWRIENELHWVIDVVFEEDQSRVRRGSADQNLALARANGGGVDAGARHRCKPLLEKEQPPARTLAFARDASSGRTGDACRV